MTDSEQKTIPSRDIKQEKLAAGFDHTIKNEVQFWQNVALNLAIFAASLIASLIISLIIMLASR